MMVFTDLIYPFFTSLFLALPRLYGFFLLLPMMNKSLFGHRLINHAIILSLGFLIRQHLPTPLPEMSTWFFFFIIIKEFFTGLLFGVIAAIPFWAMEAAGQCIDQQRGATTGNILNPLSGQQASLTGIFFSQYLILFYLTSGLFFQLIALFLRGFIWFPVFSSQFIFPATLISLFFELITLYSHAVVNFALPLIIPMYLTEIALAFVNKFAPALNVFVIAMPVKSAVALFFATGYVIIANDPLTTLIKQTFTLITTLNIPLL
ncbi:MAG TPA: EscT/YscT/HrcT family type III secretion system export apparatus protein [Morganella sp. (in: Bacteria)]|nr:EscT/YscT/HrcT family type III secretion system export apparatus protein [Morganella sp. (in: enterobacteria)]